MIGLTLFVFLLLRLAPGSPVYLLIGEYSTPQQIAELNHQLGFDRPLIIQYVSFVWDILHGNLGTSIIYQTSAARLVLQRLPATLELSTCAIVLALLVAIPSGFVLPI
jgi:dipeptide transport system permease protein